LDKTLEPCRGTGVVARTRLAKRGTTRFLAHSLQPPPNITKLQKIIVKQFLLQLFYKKNLQIFLQNNFKAKDVPETSKKTQ
jgi:hypothetical protein